MIGEEKSGDSDDEEIFDHNGGQDGYNMIDLEPFIKNQLAFKYKNECIEVLNEEASNEDMMDSLEQDDYEVNQN